MPKLRAIYIHSSGQAILTGVLVGRRKLLLTQPMKAPRALETRPGPEKQYTVYSASPRPPAQACSHLKVGVFTVPYTSRDKIASISTARLRIVRAI